MTNNRIIDNNNLFLESAGISETLVPDRTGPGSRGSAAGGPVLTLDTFSYSTERVREIVEKRMNSRRSRRLYSRIVWGLALPGRYWFLTFTSSPDSPDIEKSWKKLWWWLKRYRPGLACCYCITDEGHGVIHMVVRLGMKQKRLDAKTVRAYWEKIHNANQIKFRYVPESKKGDLANYLAYQNKKRGLGREMSWQKCMVRWRWSKGWLPKGFTRAFGRAWVKYEGVPYGLRLMMISGWLKRCHKDPDNVEFPPPKLEKDDEVGWIVRERVRA